MKTPLLYLIGGVIVAGAAVMYWKAQQPAGHVMTPQNTAQTTEGAPLAEVTVPAEFSSSAKIGEQVFNGKCASCHGVNAAGQNGIAPPLIHKIYEPNHHGDMAFLLAAQNGVRAHHWRFGDMPPVEGVTQGDIKSVVTYIRELQRENGIM